MSKSDRRYFWCDAPSPLHEAWDAAAKASDESHAKCMGLVKRIGAKEYAGHRGHIAGFIFKDKPPLHTNVEWKCLGTTKEGADYYRPKLTTRAGRQLSKEMSAIDVPSMEDVVTRASGMGIMRFTDSRMLKTVSGWRDERIFISVPNAGDGDKFPKVPAYLTECKEWEMQRWFAEGREKVAA